MIRFSSICVHKKNNYLVANTYTLHEVLQKKSSLCRIVTNHKKGQLGTHRKTEFTHLLITLHLLLKWQAKNWRSLMPRLYQGGCSLASDHDGLHCAYACDQLPGTAVPSVFYS